MCEEKLERKQIYAYRKHLHASQADHLEECKIRRGNVIEVDLGRFPGEVEVGAGQAVVFGVDQLDGDEFAGRVDA